MKKIILFVMFLITTASAFSATIAVVPYSVDPPLEKITGKDYSRLLSLGILLQKNVEVISPEEVEIAMQQTGIKPEGAITGEDLYAIGIKCRADYILIGKIRKIKGMYQFENVFYSVKNKNVVSRNNNKAGDLYSIVHQEIKDTLINISSRTSLSSKGSADIAFITDMSYSMSTEWEQVRGSIIELYSTLISRYGIDSRLYLLPYSDRRSFESVTVHNNSIRELRDRANSLQPSGSADTKTFISMLNYALTNIKWRASASKDIIIINNSKIDSLFLAEKYAADAKRRGVRIHAISGGRISTDYSDAERLAELTGGNNFSISYHQRVHDPKGGKHEIYLQRGRVFYSTGDYNPWREGILVSKSKNPRYVKTPLSLDEIFQTNIQPWPEKLAQIFFDSTGIRVMEKNFLQSNIGDILESLRDNFLKSEQENFAGKALVSDGRLSLWVKVKDPAVMERFEQYADKGFYLRCGFNVKVSDIEAYGVELLPVKTDITSDFITDFVRTSLTDIVKNKNYYTSKGLNRPPLWFVEVKVDNTERFDYRRDVRE